MANRRFEMYQYRQVLTRMRLGESDRAIARSGLMGRRKAGALRDVAGREGWLEPSSVLPDDATLAQVVWSPTSRTQSKSSVWPEQDLPPCSEIDTKAQEVFLTLVCIT